MSINQRLLKNIRKKKYKKSNAVALAKCPQKKGVCLKVFVMTPRKPNSAIRKVIRVLLSNYKKITSYIPGMNGHSLQKHSVVLIRGGNTKDLPGLKYKTIRGKLDLLGVIGRAQARSKYGVRKHV
jgi:small subunit ribosomal protein S12